MNETLAVQALETAKHYAMLTSGDSIVAGLSGGADSVSLLHWLCSIREEYQLDLCAAHLNHGLRGNESDGDEAFCRALCEAWGVPLHVKRVDLSALTSGIEEAGRNARYAFFAECAAKTPKATAPPQMVALAHTLSDRMETFLMNVGRGSALRGLCSIPLHSRPNYSAPDRVHPRANRGLLRRQPFAILHGQHKLRHRLSQKSHSQ